MGFKRAVIEYSLKHGITKAAIRYKTSWQNIYRWRKRHRQSGCIGIPLLTQGKCLLDKLPNPGDFAGYPRKGKGQKQGIQVHKN